MRVDGLTKKKQVEVMILEYFRSVYNDFPAGKLKRSESPDFIIDDYPGNKIGIELTRLNAGKNHSVFDCMIEKEIVRDAQEIFERTSVTKLMVKIGFSFTQNLIAEKQLILSVICANIVREAIKNRKAGSSFFIHLNKNLPAEIDEILILANPVLKESVWEVADYPENLVELNTLINQVIEKKEDKISLYRKKWLHQYWLLITADRLKKSQINHLTGLYLRQNNNSRLQKIFLFELSGARLFQIF